MRTEFPAMQTSLERPPRSPDREKRSRKRPAALATRGFFFVRPRSERTSSLQFVATYFGRYSSNADEPGFTHCPDGCWPRRICAAHPFLPISRCVRTTSGSSAGRSRRSRWTRRRTLGSESFARSQLRSPRRRAIRTWEPAVTIYLPLEIVSAAPDAIESYGPRRCVDAPRLFGFRLGGGSHGGGRRVPTFCQPQIEEDRFAESGDGDPLVRQGESGQVGVAERRTALDQAGPFKDPQPPGDVGRREPAQDRRQLAGADRFLEVDRRQDLQISIAEDTPRNRDVPPDRVLDVQLRHGARPEVDVLREPEAHFREDGESLHEFPEDVFVLRGQSGGRCRGQAGACLAATHSRLHREAKRFEGIWPSCTHKYTFRFSIVRLAGCLQASSAGPAGGGCLARSGRGIGSRRNSRLPMSCLQRTPCGSMTEYT